MGRELEPRITNCGPDAVPAFADAGIGQADHRETGETKRNVDFNVNRTRLDAENGSCSKAGKHVNGFAGLDRSSFSEPRTCGNCKFVTALFGTCFQVLGSITARRLV